MKIFSIIYVVNRIFYKFTRRSHAGISYDSRSNISLKTNVVCEKGSKITFAKGACSRGEAVIRADAGGQLYIGENTFINVYSNICARESITIGNNVLIANGVTIVDHDHCVPITDMNKFVSKPIIIDNNVWVGSNATILKGVHIGRNSVVAAGAVVTKSIPENVIVAGIPAKIVKQI